MFLHRTLIRRNISSQWPRVLLQYTKTAPTETVQNVSVESSDRTTDSSTDPIMASNIKITKSTIKQNEKNKSTITSDSNDFTPPKSVEDLKKWALSYKPPVSGQEAMDQLKAVSQDTLKTGTSDLRHLTETPTPTLILGTLGTIPLVLTPLAMMSQGMFSESAAMFQIAYAAAGLGFSTGMQWTSIAQQKESSWNQLASSSLPMFIAFSSLMITPILAPPLLSAGMLIALYTDQRRDLPMWFRGLRAMVTAGAVVGLMTTFLLRIVLPSPTV